MFVVWAAVAVFQVAAWPKIATDRRWRFTAIGGVLALSLAHQVMFRTLAEDAFISFRYSMNLAEGNGVVFNVGEKVEGYSNFLWVVILALPHALFDADIILTARVLGILCTLACAVLAHVLTTRITGRGEAGVLAATITAASSSLAAYGPSGMETPLFTLLVLATVLTVYSGWMLVAGLLVALATMTRPDGVVIAAVIGLWLVVRAVRNRERRRSPIVFVLGALAIAVPWTVWRLSYYGYLLPNTLAAKSGMALGEQLEHGWHYLAGFMVAAQALLLLVPVAIYALIVRGSQIEQRARSMVWLLFALAVTYLAFFTATGGDWMPAWRFFGAAMPLVAIGVVAVWALTRTVEPEQRDRRVVPAMAATVSLLLLFVSVYGTSMKDSIDEWRRQLYQMSSMGAWVNRALPDGTVVSTYANGALSFEAGPKLIMVDQLGLTDEHIARHGKRAVGAAVGHAAYDYDYVVNVRKPDVLFVRGGGFAPAQVCDHSPALAGHYRSVVFQVKDMPLWAPVYVRTERADMLIAMLDADPQFDHVPCP